MIAGSVPSIRWRMLRLVVGGQFIAAGAFGVINWDETVDFNEALTGSAAAAPATAIVTVLVVGGGGALASGRAVRLGAGMLLVFLVLATVRHLVVAADVDPRLALADLARRGQLASAAKNLALIALMVVLVGPGRATSVGLVPSTSAEGSTDR